MAKLKLTWIGKSIVTLNAKFMERRAVKILYLNGVAQTQES